MLRRRNQPEVEKLPLLARFLNHCVAKKGLTQAALAELVPRCSTSTASRWFRGQSQPTDDDLGEIARVLAIPVETFQALRILEGLRGGPMLASLAAWRYLIDGAGQRLVILGATMHAGIVHLLDARLARKTILVSLNDPRLPVSPLLELEEKYEGFASGRQRAYWLTTVSTLLAVGAPAQQNHIRLWVRPTDLHGPLLSEGRAVGHLVSNDWIALESSSILAGPRDVSAHFFGDQEWMRVVAPLADAMEGDDEGPSHSLVWDSRWPSDDARRGRMRECLDAAIAGLSAAKMLRE
jgi:transcriptional regulator with XRE-family HTH domain